MSAAVFLMLFAVTANVLAVRANTAGAKILWGVTGVALCALCAWRLS